VWFKYLFLLNIGNELKIPADIRGKEVEMFFLVQERVEGGTICWHVEFEYKSE